ncbi:MAG: dephospho-CoA kinase [Actinomycetota bacterium]|nr:dephospho-CoA kinase [Actinomycetota bacterium]
MFLVALTGGIASGKSTVCELLHQKGAYIIDSDQLAREVVSKGNPAWRDIVDHFGEKILAVDGEIDRPVLADVVFEQPEERAFLNKVTHPRIFQLISERLKLVEDETGGKGIVVLDIPLLVEANAGKMFDLTIVVDAPPRVQLERLREDRNCTKEKALARINSQVPRDERLQVADLVIENKGSMDELYREVDKAWEVIIERSGRD